ncbi:MAG: PD-(D/E)XK nuclease family protein [bacterium]
MRDNIFKILNVADKEDVISNMLVFSLNNHTSFREFFMRKITNKYDNNCSNFKAYTRTSIQGVGVPDIVINYQLNGKQFQIIVENKLKAKEGEDQTVKYSSKQLINGLKRRFNFERVETEYIFLTLFPNQEPVNKEFNKLTYKDLLDYNYNDKTVIDKLLSDFFKILNDFYECSVINFDDDVYKKLTSVPELDGGFLYFQSLIKILNLNNSLDIENFFRDSKNGRNYYGVRISKPNWHPSKLDIKEPENFLPNEHYNIHFEPQYNVLSGDFTIYLHYETNPYKPKKWVDNNIPVEKYNKYWEIRSKVKNKLRNIDIKNFQISGRTNQIAKAKIDFNNKSAEEIIKKLETLFNNNSIIIDKVLSEV